MPLQSVGSLSEDAHSIARRVISELINGDRLVYASDDGNVYATSPDDMPRIPTHWIAGTFRIGAPFDALVDDLRCLRESRLKDWILD
jgi:hypothetical protein